MMLGRLVEVISGMPFEGLGRAIFKPLGMVDTGFYVPEAKWGGLSLSMRDRPAEPLSARRKVNRMRIRKSCGHGGQGSVSTAMDYRASARC